MSEIKLLPCPCCGGDATFSDDMEDRRAEVHCIKCGVGIQVKGYPALKKALEKWNTRKPMERIIERFEKEETRKRKISEEELEECCLEMFHLYRSEADGIKQGIEIVKEEGGIE